MGLNADEMVRFWSKVEPGRGDEECWPWESATNRGGYGIVSLGGRQGGMRLAHRVAYELEVGAIPEGLELDHLCRNVLCVNPFHLEPVTHVENILRGAGVAAQHAARTHCPKGHAYDERNTWIQIRRNGQRCRVCKTCARERNNRWRRGKRVGRA